MIEILGNLLFWMLLIVGIPLLIFFLYGIIIVRDDEVGILTRKIFGNQMPQGQIIARQHGDVGIQADTLMPKLYWRNPITWKAKKVKITEVAPGMIGVVQAIDGQPLPRDRLLADHIECNSFQDAKMFLDNGGRRGVQVEILRPGDYRINTELFTIAITKATIIEKEKIGVVIAQDGQPLPPGLVIAPKQEDAKKDHKFFQDGQSFIDAKGFRGTQLDTLQPGEYYINPFLFKVIIYDITDVMPGYVAVLRSNIGQDLAKDTEVPKPVSKKPSFNQPIMEEEEVVLTTDKNERGIWRKPVAPGKYNLNPLGFTAYLVPTSAVTIDWASGSEIRAEHRVDGKIATDFDDSEKAKEFFKFSQLRVTSKDGFQLEVDVRMIIRIRSQHASFVIARFGSVANLIEQIVHPLIDSSFRNKAGEKKAIDFIMSRTELQKEALEKATGEFEKYHVEAQNLLIAYIKVDEKLLATQTEKELAIQQQTQYEQQALAQEKRIDVKEKEARAEKQKDVIAAKLSIEINKDLADAMRQEAGGIRDKTIAVANGDAYQSKTVGIAIADAYKAQAEVLGSPILGLLKSLQEIGTGQIKITPDVLVTGGSDGGGNNITNTLLAMLIKEGALNIPKPAKKQATVKTIAEAPKTSSLPKMPVEDIKPQLPSELDPEPVKKHLSDEVETMSEDERASYMQPNRRRRQS